MKFKSWKVNYEFENGLFYRPFFYIFLLFYIMWFCLVISGIRLHAIRLAKERDREHDRFMLEQVIKAFTKFIDAKDIYTGGHSERVANTHICLQRKWASLEMNALTPITAGFSMIAEKLVFLTKL
ncbi:MAG: hypothetical protein L6V90_00800 [Treponema succinifaciens]|nr:MAG: hypothetical protein L6V90_00800 [Treponema succinifaciens]